MTGHTKQCQKCQAEFLIEERDLAFYDSMSVPAPTFCPECRLRRRLSWINMRHLYARTLDTHGSKGLISMYSQDKPYTVIEDSEWWSDSFDAIQYGKPYDFSRAFFDQFRELLNIVPLPHLHRDITRMQNSNYCNAATGLKNCYLCIAADEVEDTYYSYKIEKLKNCVDLSFSNSSELCGHSANLAACYKTFYSHNCDHCTDVFYCFDCSNCSFCIGCVNLKNASYCIYNIQYTKEEYNKKIKEFALDTRSGLARVATQTRACYLAQPHRYMHGKNNTDVSGDYIYNSKNVTDSYMVNLSEDCRYINNIVAIQASNADSYDWSQFGIGSQRMYESAWCGLNCHTVRFSFWNYYAHDLTYCFGCHSSDTLFGCIGLRKKRYCILNKQYTKGEYERLVPMIIEHMNTTPYITSRGEYYRYGEFFPSELSPFGYNETDAQYEFPLKKQDALDAGYQWFDLRSRTPLSGAVPSHAIPDAIDDVGDDLKKSVIICTSYNEDSENADLKSCSHYFRYIPQEIAWHRNLRLPLPTSCPNCRHYARREECTPMHSWIRSCMCDDHNHSWHPEALCSESFATSYAPDRPEIIYCEKCYSAVVY